MGGWCWGDTRSGYLLYALLDWARSAQLLHNLNLLGKSMALERENLWIFAPSVPSWVTLSKSLNIHELVLLALKWDHNTFHSAFVLCFFFFFLYNTQYLVHGRYSGDSSSFLFILIQPDPHLSLLHLINTFHQTLVLPRRIYLPCICLCFLFVMINGYQRIHPSIHPSS